ncbi:MAG: hypothetical protein ACR2FY_19815 [Pirellulaceae bacterium]
MNAEARTELLAAIVELSMHYPDWRLGQLVANISGWADQDIWDAEDGQLLEACRANLAGLKTQFSGRQGIIEMSDGKTTGHSC